MSDTVVNIAIGACWFLFGGLGYLLLRANWMRRYGPEIGARESGERFMVLFGPITLFVAVVFTTIHGWEPR